MLIIKDLKKSFGEKTVLQNINLKCEKGKICGIMGRNGSGKSVLFKCICGFMDYERGEILLNGVPLDNKCQPQNNIDFIIESPAFLPQYSGLKNLSILYSINHRPNVEIIKDYMRRVGLDPENYKRVEKYSMGMKQRLAIAQAIMDEPELLILDEPFNGLDKEGVKEIRKLILELKENKIILLASHNKEDIMLLCDEAFELDRGCMSELSIEQPLV